MRQEKSSHGDILSDITAYENKIDEFTCRLYGLTPEGIAIVEEISKGK